MNTPLPNGARHRAGGPLTAPPATPPAAPPAAPLAALPAELLDARERAIRLLTDGYADGRVGDAEFEMRLARLRAAADPAAMDAVVAGLADRVPPATLPPARLAPPPLSHAAPPGAVAAPRPLPPAERRLLAVMSETRRNGWWEVPQLLRVRAIMSDVKLDLRDAAIPPGCTIDVSAYLAAVVLIVRPETIVSFDVLPMLGSAFSRAVAPAGPTADIHVTGNSVLAEVKVIVRERAARA